MPEVPTIQSELMRVIRQLRLAGRTSIWLSPWNMSCMGRRPGAGSRTMPLQERNPRPAQPAAVSTGEAGNRASSSSAAPWPTRSTSAESNMRKPLVQETVKASGMAAASAQSFGRPGNSQISPAVPVPAPNGIDAAAVASASWEALEQMLPFCKGCAFSACGRLAPLLEGGSRQASVMFVGDYPSQEDDENGAIFSGKTGELLDKILAAMGLARNGETPDKAVYLANLMKCRRPADRNAMPAEAQVCLAYLKRQINLVKPRVIVLLGGIATRFVLGIDSLNEARGIWQKYGDIPVMPTYHPLFLIRMERNQEALKDVKRKMWNDMKAVMEFLQTESGD